MKKDLIKRVKVTCLEVFRYFNTLVELCVTTKNHALYLYNRLFGVFDAFTDQFVSYEGEYKFIDNSEIKEFEDKEGIDRYEQPNEIVKEVIDSLISDISFQDLMFDRDLFLKELDEQK